MLSILALGFLLGLRHTLEADHVAAVATLTTRTSSVRQAVPLGLLWGIGHSLALATFGLAVLLLETVIPQNLVLYLELAVGVMLIGLGADVLIRLIRQRIHFHVHRHDGGVVHFHAHGHNHDRDHDRDHTHSHVLKAGGNLRVRAFMIGIMHGMAGSAVLIVLTMQSLPSLSAGAVYIALFGAGSMLGMAVLSAAIAWPLHRWGQTLTWLNHAARAGVGGLTMVLGAAMVLEYWGVV